MSSFDNIQLAKEDYQSGWDKAYIEDESVAHLWKQEPIEFLPNFSSRLKELGVKHILEVGCGDGRNTVYLLKQGFQVTSIDISPKALARALKQVQQQNLTGGVFINSDLELLPNPFPAGSFDAIVCLDVFGQLLHMQEVVSGFYQVIKPGGVVLSNLYTLQDANFGVGERLGEKTFVYKKTLFRFFTEENVRALFNDFKVIDLQRVSWEDPPHPGYRDNYHQHDAWVALLQKPPLAH